MGRHHLQQAERRDPPLLESLPEVGQGNPRGHGAVGDEPRPEGVRAAGQAVESVQDDGQGAVHVDRGSRPETGAAAGGRWGPGRRRTVAMASEVPEGDRLAARGQPVSDGPGDGGRCAGRGEEEDEMAGRDGHGAGSLSTKDRAAGSLSSGSIADGAGRAIGRRLCYNGGTSAKG